MRYSRVYAVTVFRKCPPEGVFALAFDAAASASSVVPGARWEARREVRAGTPLRTHLTLGCVTSDRCFLRPTLLTCYAPTTLAGRPRRVGLLMLGRARGATFDPADHHPIS